MWKILILFLTIIIICVLICNTKVFPLSAGSIDSGTQAIKSIKQQTQRRKIYNYPLVAIIVEPRKDNLVNILQARFSGIPIPSLSVTECKQRYATYLLSPMWR